LLFYFILFYFETGTESNGDCTTCTNTIMSDGIRTCSWYAAGGYCGTGKCESVGTCGTTICNNEQQQQAEEAEEAAAEVVVVEAETVTNAEDDFLEVTDIHFSEIGNASTTTSTSTTTATSTTTSTAVSKTEQNNRTASLESVSGTSTSTSTSTDASATTTAESESASSSSGRSSSIGTRRSSWVFRYAAVVEAVVRISQSVIV